MLKVFSNSITKQLVKEAKTKHFLNKFNHKNLLTLSFSINQKLVPTLLHFRNTEYDILKIVLTP